MNVDVVEPSLILIATAGILIAIGTYLMLERSLSRIVIGVSFVGNGINLLFLVAGGHPGRPPLNTDGVDGMVDPLPQAFMLTAIVITLGTIAFLLAMAYRSWQLNGHDEVQDDLEDRRLARRAALDEVAERVTDDSGSTLAEDAAATVDETATDAEDRHTLAQETILEDDRWEVPDVQPEVAVDVAVDAEDDEMEHDGEDESPGGPL